MISKWFMNEFPLSKHTIHLKYKLKNVAFPQPFLSFSATAQPNIHVKANNEATQKCQNQTVQNHLV